MTLKLCFLLLVYLQSDIFFKKGCFNPKRKAGKKVSLRPASTKAAPGSGRRRVVPPLRAALRSRAHTCHAFVWLNRAPFGRLRLYANASSRRPSNDATCRWPAADLMDRPPLRYGRTTKVDRGLLPPSLRAGQIAANASHDHRRAGLPVQHGRPRGDGGESSWSVRSPPVPGAATFENAILPSASPLQSQRCMLPPAISKGIYSGAISPLALPDEAVKAWILLSRPKATSFHSLTRKLFFETILTN